MKHWLVAALSAIGLTAVSMLAGVTSVAGADPCTNWQHHGPINIDHSDKVVVQVADFNGGYADGGSSLFYKDGSPVWLNPDGSLMGHYSYVKGNNYPYDAPHAQTGQTFGGIIAGSNNFDMTVVWADNKGSNRYIGTVDPKGHISGNVTNSSNGITTQWDIREAFTCAP